MNIQSTRTHTAKLNLPSPKRAPQGAEAPEPTKGGDDSFSHSVASAVLRGTIYGAIGSLLGAGMAEGGVGGLVCGALAGGTLGTQAIGPMGNGKGAEGLVYPLAGLVAGSLVGGYLGATGVTHGAWIVGATMGGLQVGRAVFGD